MLDDDDDDTDIDVVCVYLVLFSRMTLLFAWKSHILKCDLYCLRHNSVYHVISGKCCNLYIHTYRFMSSNCLFLFFFIFIIDSLSYCSYNENFGLFVGCVYVSGRWNTLQLTCVYVLDPYLSTAHTNTNKIYIVIREKSALHELKFATEYRTRILHKRTNWIIYR